MVTCILSNCLTYWVPVAEKKQSVLEVALALVEIIGEAWLVGPMIVPDDQKPVPSDRYHFLVSSS